MVLLHNVIYKYEPLTVASKVDYFQVPYFGAKAVQRAIAELYERDSNSFLRFKKGEIDIASLYDELIINREETFGKLEAFEKVNPK